MPYDPEVVQRMRHELTRPRALEVRAAEEVEESAEAQVARTSEGELEQIARFENEGGATS